MNHMKHTSLALTMLAISMTTNAQTTDINAAYSALCLGDSCAFYNGAGKLQFIKPKGEINDPRYGKFNVGTVSSQNNHKYGLLNRQGRWVLSPTYDFMYDFADNGLAQVKKDGKYGYINQKGEVVIPLQYDDTWAFTSNGLAMAKKDGKWGYINQKGEVVIPLQYDDAWVFTDNGLAMAKKDGKWGYINQKGEVVIPLQYDDALGFADNGLAQVKKDGKYGYINQKGEVVIPLQYDSALGFADNGLMTEKNNDGWASINKKGEKVVYFTKVCDGEVDILKNRDGQILLPQNKSEAQICQAHTKAKAERERQEREAYEKACDRFYPGKTGVYVSTSSWLLGTNSYRNSYVVRYVNKPQHLITVEFTNTTANYKQGEMKEFSCSDNRL